MGVEVRRLPAPSPEKRNIIEGDVCYSNNGYPFFIDEVDKVRPHPDSPGHTRVRVRNSTLTYTLLGNYAQWYALLARSRPIDDYNI